MPDILTIFHLLSYCRIFGLNLSVALRLQIGSLSEADLPTISLKGGRKGYNCSQASHFLPQEPDPHQDLLRLEGETRILRDEPGKFS